VTVLDSSAVIDYLVGSGVAESVEAILTHETVPAAAPDLLVFEVLAVMRRHVQGDAIAPERAASAIEALGDLSLELVPTLALRGRAWELRENLTAGDALFVALAERLGEPLATKDRGLAQAARAHAGIETIELGFSP
jgi:predicted nucleic acid-binding protein